MIGRLVRALQSVATGLFALLLLFEEWGWEPLRRAVAWLMRWPPLAALERAIARLPPYGALLVFFVPMLLLLPVKLGALWLIAQGHALLGVALVLAAKVVGTALVAHLFHLTQPALMRLGWFASLYTRWTGWKEAVFERVRASWAWRSARVMRRRLAARWARWRGAA